MKKNIIWFLLIIVLAGGIIFTVYYKKPQSTNNEAVANNATVNESTEINQKVVEYQGSNGKNVLDLLKEIAEVKYTDSESGAFIYSINGIENSDSEFWLYSINGKDGMVAADKMETKNSDKIKWEYKGF